MNLDKNFDVIVIGAGHAGCEAAAAAARSGVNTALITNSLAQPVQHARLIHHNGGGLVTRVVVPQDFQKAPVARAILIRGHHAI